MADASIFKNTAFTRVLPGSTASGFATFLFRLEVAQGRFAASFGVSTVLWLCAAICLLFPLLEKSGWRYKGI